MALNRHSRWTARGPRLLLGKECSLPAANVEASDDGHQWHTALRLHGGRQWNSQTGRCHRYTVEIRVRQTGFRFFVASGWAVRGGLARADHHVPGCRSLDVPSATWGGDQIDLGTTVPRKRSTHRPVSFRVSYSVRSLDKNYIRRYVWSLFPNSRQFRLHVCLSVCKTV